MTFQVTIQFHNAADVRQWLKLWRVEGTDHVILDWDEHLHASVVGGVTALEANLDRAEREE